MRQEGGENVVPGVQDITLGVGYGMEMDSYKSRFMDGCPGGYGTILYSIIYT